MGFIELGAARWEQGPISQAPWWTGKVSPSSRKHEVEGAVKPEAIRGSPGLGTLVFSLPWESSSSSLDFCSSPLGPLAEALNFNIFCCSFKCVPGEWVPGWVPGPWCCTQGAWGTMGVWLWQGYPPAPHVWRGAPLVPEACGMLMLMLKDRLGSSIPANTLHSPVVLGRCPSQLPTWAGRDKTVPPPHQPSPQGQPGEHWRKSPLL